PYNIEIYSINPDNPANNRNPGKYQHSSCIRYESYSTFVTSRTSKNFINNIEYCSFNKERNNTYNRCDDHTHKYREKPQPSNLTIHTIVHAAVHALHIHLTAKEYG